MRPYDAVLMKIILALLESLDQAVVRLPNSREDIVQFIAPLSLTLQNVVLQMYDSTQNKDILMKVFLKHLLGLITSVSSLSSSCVKITPYHMLFFVLNDEDARKLFGQSLYRVSIPLGTLTCANLKHLAKILGLSCCTTKYEMIEKITAKTGSPNVPVEVVVAHKD